MKSIITYLFLVVSLSVQCQDTLRVGFVFEKGLYTSFQELLQNNPKYPNCEMDEGGQIFINQFNYFDSQGIERVYQDSLFAMVKNKKVKIFFMHHFYSSFIIGTISLFPLKEHARGWEAYNSFNNLESEYIYLDFTTGEINFLHLKNIEKIFKRDAELYQEFEGMSKSKKKEMINYFVLKFNKRNPTLIDF